jgi:hypothetical protein
MVKVPPIKPAEEPQKKSFTQEEVQAILNQSVILDRQREFISRGMEYGRQYGMRQEVLNAGAEIGRVLLNINGPLVFVPSQPASAPEKKEDETVPESEEE